MHFEILCNKMVFSQKNIPRKKKKKTQVKGYWECLLKTKGMTQNYVHSPVNILSKKRQ